MAIVLLPGYRITDDNGTPISGGKLYVFEAGTSNPRDVYTDSALTAAHSHPVIADAGGLLPDIYSAEDELKVRVTDASDNTIWEIDGYTSGSTGSSSGSASREILSKTANYTVASEDNGKIVAMDASGIGGLQGDVTAGAATLGAGFLIGVKNVGATGNTLIQGTGAETIDGAANRLLTTQYEFLDMASRGAAGWFVLASQGTSEVSVTIQQADGSSDGVLNFENELGVTRWIIAHKQTSDELHIQRYDSGGNFVDFPLKFDTNGDLIISNDLTISGAATVTGALSAAPRVTLIETLTPTSGATETSATIDFATLKAAGYRDLVIEFDGISTNGDADLLVEVSDDDGSSWNAASDVNAFGVYRNVTTLNIMAMGAGLQVANLESASSNAVDGHVVIENFADATTDFPKHISFSFGATVELEEGFGVGNFIGIGAIDKVRFRVASNNFDGSGSAKIFARS